MLQVKHSISCTRFIDHRKIVGGIYVDRKLNMVDYLELMHWNCLDVSSFVNEAISEHFLSCTRIPQCLVL